jgi:DNA-binding NtrC family response regulator
MAAVLVVDDNPFAREALGNLLTREGLEVRLADGLESASAVLAAEPCEVVVSDLLRAHGVSPLDAVANLRATYSETPTILLTADAEAKAWKADVIGMATVLVKPFDIDGFLVMVRRTLEQQRKSVAALQTRSEATQEILRQTRRTIDQGWQLHGPPDDPSQRG